MSGMRISKIKSQFKLGSLLRLLLLLVGYLLLTFLQPAFAQTISYLAGDPQGGIGFNRAHYASTMSCIVVPYGTSGAGAWGDNSVRCYNALSNTWIYLWPNESFDAKNSGTSGPQNRDNHVSFFVRQ